MAGFTLPDTDTTAILQDPIHLACQHDTVPTRINQWNVMRVSGSAKTAEGYIHIHILCDVRVRWPR